MIILPSRLETWVCIALYWQLCSCAAKITNWEKTQDSWSMCILSWELFYWQQSQINNPINVLMWSILSLHEHQNVQIRKTFDTLDLHAVKTWMCCKQEAGFARNWSIANQSDSLLNPREPNCVKLMKSDRCVCFHSWLRCLAEPLSLYFIRILPQSIKSPVFNTPRSLVN